MVDIMSHSEMSKDDFEDGELPEDGEICDDDDEAMKPAAPVPSVSSEHSKESRTSTEHHHHHHSSRRHHSVNHVNATPRRRQFEFQPPPPSSLQRDLDPFGPDSEVNHADAAAAAGGDKDYRGGNGAAGERIDDEPPFNDYDYRTHRKRRHSPMHNDETDYESRAGKRSYYGGRGGFRGGFRGGAKPRFNTEHQICKFFREGYCRDGDQCSYSHQAEDSLRRPILCNFYANSFCKKGLQCLMLHGEYPCTDFHRGNCTAEQCRYSHVPLTDYTKPLFEKSLADEEARGGASYGAYRQPVNAGGARRRVLLPGGPAAASPPQAPIIHAPVPQQMNGQLAPPSVVVPTIQRPMPPGYPPTAFFNQGTTPHIQQQNLPPPRTIEPPKPVTQPEKPAPPTFNLEAMLTKLAKGEALASDDEESPASPPPINQITSNAPSSFLAQTAIVIPETRSVVWRHLLSVQQTPYAGVDNLDLIPPNDPRKSRALEAAAKAAIAIPDEVTDPRIRSNNYDINSYDEPEPTSQISSWMPQMS
ncbi:unnamed protein product [Caenorhabditis bovis]|uniref:C3H1-type domain-containing protein n=1 Tax=Caenorhabditis bovis TaxID=2654633 RepID=A0A8S1F3Z8_9PELO|nr:unnamed protein product [Caenorhabditis bovis]